MNARIALGSVIVLVWLAMMFSPTANPVYSAAIAGSGLGIILYLRATDPGQRKRFTLWLFSTLWAFAAGWLWTWAAATTAEGVGYALGIALFAGIPLAAASELILSGKARLHRCPLCTKPVSRSASVCPHCRRDIAPQGEPVVFAA